MQKSFFFKKQFLSILFPLILILKREYSSPRPLNALLPLRPTFVSFRRCTTSSLCLQNVSKLKLKFLELVDSLSIKNKIISVNVSGVITSVKDGVAIVYGLREGLAGEMIYTTSALKPNGMILNLHKSYVSVVIFGMLKYKYGTHVFRTMRLPVTKLLLAGF